MPECRILVIDDDLPAALKMAKRIRELELAPALQSLDIKMGIEVSNSAMWAWSALDGASDRWDIIFSDVMMPLEEQFDAKHTQKDGYTVWVTSGPKSTPSFQGGGFDLAKNLSDWRHNRPDLQLPKLVLLSAALVAANRRNVNTFARENREWFQYFDKDECPQHWRGDRLNLYRYALLQALVNYQAKSWNDGQFHPATSEWRSLRYEASRMARQQHVRHVLVLGPTGSGKSVLARFLLSERGFNDPPIIGAGMLDKDGLKARWHQGGLYIDQLERMSPAAHDPVYRELEEMAENQDGEQKLCVWSAKSISDLRESEVLSESFVSLLQTHSLQIDNLRAEDVSEITGSVVDQYAPGFPVVEEVYGELATTDWPDNLRGIQVVLREAIHRAKEFGDSELRVDHLQLPNRKAGTNGQAIAASTQSPSISLQHDVASGMTPSVPEMNGPDVWTFAQERVLAIQKELKTVRAVIENTNGRDRVSGADFILSRRSEYPALATCNSGILDTAINYFKNRDWNRSLKDLAAYVFSAGDHTRFEDLQKDYGVKKQQSNYSSVQRRKRGAV